MRIIVKKGAWTQAASFSEALGELLKPPVKIAFVGSGGKTSTIMRLAEEQRAAGRRVLVLTTTHMFCPGEHGIFSQNADEVETVLKREGIAIAGKVTDSGKISWQGEKFYREIAPLADVVLIEADGSKRLPAKFPSEYEPVIPANIDVILALSGLSAIGKSAAGACHRWELARQALKIADEDVLLKPEHLRELMRMGFLLPLSRRFPGVPIIPVFNQADSQADAETGMKITDELGTDTGIVSSFRAPSIGIVFMASGFGRRFGSNKLMYRLGGRPLYEHALSNLTEAAGEIGKDCRVKICVASQYEEILAEAEKRGLIAAENPDSGRGITASIRLGLKSLPAAEYYAFFVADQPYLKAETTADFIRRFLASGKTLGCVTDGEATGNPCIFSSRYLPELMALEGDSGGKKIISEYPEEVFYFKVGPTERFDLDRPEDLR